MTAAGPGAGTEAGVGSPSAPPATPEWPEAPLKGSERAPVLITAGVWLVFLLLPLVSITTGDADPGQKVLGYLGLAAFVAVYLGNFIRPWIWRSRPLWVSTLAVTAVLLGCVIATIPAAGLNSFNFLPFTLAIWIFPHRPAVGIPVAGGLAAVWLATALLVDADDSGFWLVMPTGLALVIMVALRVAMEREERARVLGEELALSRQREQVGRDVHDVLGHSLTVITLKTELARRLVDTDPQRAAAELDEVLGISRRALSEVRLAVGGLHAPDLAGQVAAARTALEAAGISPRLPAPTTVAGLPADHRRLFAWCLREAVTNVIRHSGATTCTVTLRADRLEVHDDGRGPGAALTSGAVPTPAAGNGLRGMHQRVSEAGGTLSVREAQPGRDRPGTTLQVRL